MIPKKSNIQADSLKEISLHIEEAIYDSERLDQLHDFLEFFAHCFDDMNSLDIIHTQRIKVLLEEYLGSAECYIDNLKQSLNYAAELMNRD